MNVSTSIHGMHIYNLETPRVSIIQEQLIDLSKHNKSYNYFTDVGLKFDTLVATMHSQHST